jgi:transposase-like protein
MSKTVTGHTIIRYSESFKLAVIRDIEENHLTIHSALKKYDIRGSLTINNWMRKYGKAHLLSKKIIVMEINERDELAGLKERLAEVERLALSQQLELQRVGIYYSEALRQIGLERPEFEKKTGLGR